jgi:hypothetical protein
VHFTRDVFTLENPVLADALAPDSPERPARVFVVETQVAHARPELRDQIRAYFEHHGQSLRLAADLVSAAGGEPSP